jgi:matrixin
MRLLAASLLLSCLISSAEASASRYRWRKGPITIAVSTSITSNTANIQAGTDINAAIDRSMSSWQQAAAVSFRRTATTEQNASPAGNQGDGISVITIAATSDNIALFPQGLEDATARTRVFYDARGFITEADIVLNPFLQFSTEGTPGTFDLQSTLTHELGHVLGLSHSPVIGATMNEDYGRNGVYSLPAFSARTLSSDDIVAVRSLYGPADPNDECCGRISGKLILNAGKPAANYTIWAEDGADGRVIAAVNSLPDGSFKMSGLPVGKLRILAQNNDTDSLSSAADLGEVTLTTRQPVSMSKKIERTLIDAHLDYMGFNGQIAEIAVPVNSGSSYLLLAGSSSLGDDPIIESSSDLIHVAPASFSGNFANHIRTVQFEVSVASDAPSGEYSLALRTTSGERRFLIGGITVEKFPNFWSTTNFK